MKPLRTLITPIVIAAVATAGLAAAPARAANDDLAKILIGLGALAITVDALERQKKTSSSASVSRSTYGDRIVTLPEPSRRHQRLSHALPESCLRTYETRRGDRRLYSGRCLSKVPYRLAELPAACAYTIMDRKRARGKAYGPRCLARYGFFRVDEDFRHDRRREQDRDRPARHIVYGD